MKTLLGGCCSAISLKGEKCWLGLGIVLLSFEWRWGLCGVRLARARRAQPARGSELPGLCTYSTQCIYQIALESQLPYRIEADAAKATLDAHDPRAVQSCQVFISQNVFLKWFEKVNSPTKLLTYCLLLLIETIS